MAKRTHHGTWWVSRYAAVRAHVVCWIAKNTDHCANELVEDFHDEFNPRRELEEQNNCQ